MNWSELIKYSSVQLRKFDDEDKPCGFGSGCLLDFKEHRFLLTVFHVTKTSSKWSAQIKFNEEVLETEVLYLNEFCYFAKPDVDENSIKDVEFSFHLVRPNITWYFHNRNLKEETLELEERPIFTIDDIDEPNKDINYGFSGDIQPISFPDINALETRQHIYHGLKYDRSENDMHYFKLPEDHPGHNFFEGCSGAPIIGEDGKVVSLLSGGCIKTNEVYGNNLQKCIRSLDHYIK